MIVWRIGKNSIILYAIWKKLNDMTRTITIADIADVAKTIMPKGTKVWLYGSRARGEGRSDSDWDILVLIDKEKIENEDFIHFGYPMIEYGWHFGADLSPQLYTQKDWGKMRITPYYQNIEHDKKIIYES